jgi:hypothetical protein
VREPASTTLISARRRRRRSCSARALLLLPALEEIGGATQISWCVSAAEEECRLICVCVFSTGQNCQLENLLLMGFNLPAAAGARASQQRTLVQEASGCLIIRLLAFFPRLLLISMWQ